MKQLLYVVLVLTIIPLAYAQEDPNTSMLHNIFDDTEVIFISIHNLAHDIEFILGDVRSLLIDLLPIIRDTEDVLDDTNQLTNTIQSKIITAQENIVLYITNANLLNTTIVYNSISIQNIEDALLGKACGMGTQAINGVCESVIQSCNGTLIENSCYARLYCGPGTIQHNNACTADFSPLFCGNGTVYSNGSCRPIGN